MPSERHRKKTKEDTWGAEELSKSIKDAMKDDSARRHRSHDKDSSHKDRTKDRERRREKEHRDRDRERDGDRAKRRDKHKTVDVGDLDGHHDIRETTKEEKERNRSQGRSHIDKKDKEGKYRDEISHEKKMREDEKHSSDRERHKKDREKRSHDKEGRRSERDKRKEKHREDVRRKKDDSDNRFVDEVTGRKKGENEKRRDRKDRDNLENQLDDKTVDKEGRKKDDDDRRRHRKDRERRHQEKREGDMHREEKKDKMQEDQEKSHLETKEKRSRHGKKAAYTEDDVQPENNNEQSDIQTSYQDDNYEDDFEDYEDDFEDEDESDDDEDDNYEDDSILTRESSAEMDAVRRAMASENQAMQTGRKHRETSSSASSSRSTTAKSSHSFVNFVAAKQRQISSQAWQRSRKRGKELMKLIELDVVGYDLFDMAPLKEYELYIKSFGRSNTKQAFVQCNDDNLDRDVQTDPMENREMWTQHPAEGIAAFGGVGEKGDEAVNESDSLRLTKFLQKAGQAISILLEEEGSENAKGSLQSNQRSISFSDGYTQLNSKLSFLEGRHVVNAQFHPVQTNLLLTIHSAPKKGAKNGLSTRGLLCVWNVNEPSRPQKILSCKSTPTCCCFSPTKSTFAFAGTLDGSIVVWDLREPSKMHADQRLTDGEWTIRVPTFSTDGVRGHESHHSSVVTVQPIVAAEESLKASMQGGHVTDNMEGLSFQLASLEEKGIIHFSVIIEIDKPELAGSECDLGLVPCGKTKLIQTSSVSLSMSPSRSLGADLKTFHMQLSILDPNQYFVATDSGHVLHGARHGGRVPPQIFRDKLEVPVDIVQIDFSPFRLSIFLVACSDGSIRLYNTTSEVPTIIWRNSTNGVAIQCIQWSRSRPCVFYVMDKASKVYVWQLLENDASPVEIEQFTSASLTSLIMSNDHQTSVRGQPGKSPEMLITDCMGTMEVHRINKTFSTASLNEMEAVADLLHNMI